MSEIEKLYENAGFKTEIVPCYSLNCEYFEVDKGYPPFTAEKQLELIKWLIEEVDYLTLWHFIGNKEYPYDFDLGHRNATAQSFEECLAKLINVYWQDLTPEEQQQIKEILE